MMDFTCFVFVRSKQPTPEMLDLAEQNGISVLSTDLRMYTACGLLYTNGLIGANDDR